jgi:hypothetical protein
MHGQSHIRFPKNPVGLSRPVMGLLFTYFGQVRDSSSSVAFFFLGGGGGPVAGINCEKGGGWVLRVTFVLVRRILRRDRKSAGVGGKLLASSWLSVRLPFRIAHLGSHWTDFREV